MRHPRFPLPYRAARLAALALGLAAAAGPLPAQRLDDLAAGARLRVARHAPPRPVVGTLVRADSTGLTLSPARGGPALVVPLADLRRVDVSRGARPAPEAFWRGAGVGFLVGAGVGVVATGLAYQSDRRSSCDCIIPATAIVGALSVAFTGVTTLTGGVIGVATRERWRQAWPPR